MGVRKSRCVFLFLLLLILVGTGSPAAAEAPFACDPSDPATQSYGFCKTTLPIEQPVDNLVSRLTLEEKIPRLGNAAAGIPWLGILAYQWWSESLHGVSNWCPGVRFDGVVRSATSFPQVILSAAALDPRL